jgi:multiple sugar transport system permease protein
MTATDMSRTVVGGRDQTTDEQARAHVRGSRRRPRSRSLLATVFMMVVLLYSLLPLVWLVFSSTKTNSGLFDSFGYWFASDFRPWANIRDLFSYQDGVFARWMINTIVYSVVSAGGAAVLAALGGYAFAKYEFRGKRLVYAVILGSIMVPTTALAIPTYLLFSRVGIVDSPAAIILPSLVNPFGIFLMKAYAQDAVSDSVIESARIDGAGEFRIFWSIAFRGSPQRLSRFCCSRSSRRGITTFCPWSC